MLSLVQRHIRTPATECAIARDHLAAAADFRQDDIDQSVHGIGTVFRTARPAHDFNPARHFMMWLEQAVNIAKSGRAHRDAILHDQETSLPGPSGQDG